MTATAPAKNRSGVDRLFTRAMVDSWKANYVGCGEARRRRQIGYRQHLATCPDVALPPHRHEDFLAEAAPRAAGQLAVLAVMAMGRTHYPNNWRGVEI